MLVTAGIGANSRPGDWSNPARESSYPNLGRMKAKVSPSAKLTNAML